jgi:hypothetical protein
MSSGKIIISDTVFKRIRAKKRGWVFTPKDFIDLGSRAAIDQTLSRLVSKGLIRRLDRGLYDFPRLHPTLGTLSPDMADLANAKASQTGDIAFASGAMAANILGLSTQVPAKPIYSTNGKSRMADVAGKTITYKHSRVPILDSISQNANLALQALYYFGKNNITSDIIAKCAKRLDSNDLRQLNKVKPQIPSWLADTILKIENAVPVSTNG